MCEGGYTFLEISSNMHSCTWEMGESRQGNILYSKWFSPWFFIHVSWYSSFSLSHLTQDHVTVGACCGPEFQSMRWWRSSEPEHSQGPGQWAGAQEQEEPLGWTGVGKAPSSRVTERDCKVQTGMAALFIRGVTYKIISQQSRDVAWLSKTHWRGSIHAQR